MLSWSLLSRHLHLLRINILAVLGVCIWVLMYLNSPSCTKAVPHESRQSLVYPVSLWCIQAVPEGSLWYIQAVPNLSRQALIHPDCLWYSQAVSGISRQILKYPDCFWYIQAVLDVLWFSGVRLLTGLEQSSLTASGYESWPLLTAEASVTLVIA